MAGPENARFEGRLKEAASYYSRVIEATAENGDDNLRSSAILGAVICDISSIGGLTFHDSHDDLEASLMEAEQISDKYDMLITKARIDSIRVAMQLDQTESKNAVSYTSAKLKQLGLTRDVQLLESGKAAMQRLEIHVH